MAALCVSMNDECCVGVGGCHVWVSWARVRMRFHGFVCRAFFRDVCVCVRAV